MLVHVDLSINCVIQDKRWEECCHALTHSSKHREKWGNNWVISCSLVKSSFLWIHSDICLGNPVWLLQRPTGVRTHILTCELNVLRIISLSCRKKMLAFFWRSFLFDFHDPPHNWLTFHGVLSKWYQIMGSGLTPMYLHTNDLISHREILHIENIKIQHCSHFRAQFQAKN